MAGHALETREHIGADPYVEATPGPTPTVAAEPTPTYKLLTAPPESSSSSAEATAESGENESQAPENVEAAIDPESVDPDTSDGEPVLDENIADLQSNDESSSGTCSAPTSGSVDGTAGAWLLVVVGLAAGGRYRSRKSQATRDR